MMNKLMNKLTSPVQSETAAHLKNVFDESLAVLSEDKEAVNNPQKIRVQRSSLPLHTDTANLQKLALDNAAHALAALWKISGPGRVKPRTAV
jgi:hypothetical protein